MTSVNATTYEFLGRLAAAEQRQESIAERGYDGGKINRLNFNWTPRNRSANAEMDPDNPLMRARARDLARNDALGVAALDAWVRMVVGTGIPTFSDVVDEQGDPLDDFNEASDQLFEDWMAEAGDMECVHHYDQQRLIFSEIVESGDGLILECQDNRGGRLLPICFQVLEIDYLDQGKERPRGLDQNRIHKGIEYDVFNRPTAYWLFDQHPVDSVLSLASPKSRRIPAQRVLHRFWKNRPTQTRGITWFHSVVKHLINMGGYLGSELTSARVASQFAINILRDEGAGSGLGVTGDDGDSDPEDAFGNSLEDLGFPVISDLQRGDDVKVVESSRPGNQHAHVWLKFMLTLMAAGMKLSYQSLTREATGTFSGNKATRLCDEEAVKPIYDWLARCLAVDVRRRVMTQAILEGHFRNWVQPFEFKRNMRHWLKFTFPAPQLNWLDPTKETSAVLNGIAGGIGDYETAWGRKGIFWRKAFRKLQRQRSYAQSIGLQLPDEAPPATPAPATPARTDQELIQTADGIIDASTGEAVDVIDAATGNLVEVTA